MIVVFETFYDSVVVRGIKTDIEISLEKSASGDYIGKDVYTNDLYNLGNEFFNAVKSAARIAEVE